MNEGGGINYPSREIEREESRVDILESDIKQAHLLLEKQYKIIAGMSSIKDGRITEKIVEEGLKHVGRAVEYAEWVGDGEKGSVSKNAYVQSQFAKKLRLAAIFQNISRLAHNVPGCIDVFGQHALASEKTKSILSNKFHFTPEFVDEIKDAILASPSYAIFIARSLGKADANKKDRLQPLPQPKTFFEHALRDVNILALSDMHGFKTIVELRQNQESRLFAVSNGDIKKAIKLSLEDALASMTLLHTDTAKKIADGQRKLLIRLIKFIKDWHIDSTADFVRAYDVFFEKAREEVSHKHAEEGD